LASRTPTKRFNYRKNSLGLLAGILQSLTQQCKLKFALRAAITGVGQRISRNPKQIAAA
jgi:hypothetical protein